MDRSQQLGGGVKGLQPMQLSTQSVGIRRPIHLQHCLAKPFLEKEDLKEFNPSPVTWAKINEVVGSIVNVASAAEVIQPLIDALNAELNHLADGLETYSDHDLLMAPLYAGTPAFKKLCQRRLDILVKINELQLTMDRYKRVYSKRRILRVESGNMAALGSEGPVTTAVTTENFTDMGGSDVYTADAGSSRNTDQGQQGTLAINEFFSRPVEIYAAQLPLATDFNYIINVWDLYSKIPSIRAKFRNHAYMRGNLHIRTCYSATPMHYGATLQSYQPVPTANDNLTAYADALATTALSRPAYINYLSQAPGSQIVDIKDNTPIDMVCPFISTKPMHRLFNPTTTVLGDTTALKDFSLSGSLYIVSINQIKAVTPTPSLVYLQVYAWMEDVELGPPTGTQIAITTESGNMDERETGPVEKIASAATTVANALTSVPIIGPFARASAMAFGALKNIAALFGWSRPHVIKDPIFVKSRPYANSASTIGAETVEKISLDPKQELTVDPRIVGVDTDDMIFDELCSRWSYLTTFNWNDDSPVLSTPLWSSLVNPAMATSFVYNTRRFTQPTAMGFSAMPFMFWRGDIEFRFHCIVSTFHRGKGAFIFDMNNFQYGLITASTSLNKQFIKIVDLQETQIVDFCVKWAAPRPWMQLPPGTDAWKLTGDVASYSSTNGMFNGFIYFVPFTKLQSPDNSDIQVNVYVRSTNMRFSVPIVSNLPPARRLVSQSGVYAESGTMDVSCKTVVPIDCFELNDSTADDSMITQEYMGEEIFSFRSLLKRYMTLPPVLNNDATTNQTGLVSFPVYPNNNLAYGATAWAVNTPELFSYLRLAYHGVRGGIRYRFHLGQPLSTGPTATWKVSFDSPNSAITTTAFTLGSSPAYNRLQGTLLFIPTTNGGIEVEFPFYSNNLYLPCANNNYFINDSDYMNITWLKNAIVEIESNPGVTTLGFNYFMREIAMAEDFCFMRFQGAPFFSET